MRALTSSAWQIFLCCLSVSACLDAQEGAGKAEISAQQYYLAIDSHQIANITGLGLSFSEFIPEIAARGGAMEATHGTRTFGFFYGEGTISNTPRVVLRQQVPQSLMGAYWRQAFGTRLLLGARLMNFSNDVAALRKLPNFLTQNALRNATTLSF